VQVATVRTSMISTVRMMCKLLRESGLCVCSNDKSRVGLVRLLRRSAVDWGLRCLGAPYDTHTRSSIEQCTRL
jgi:hypothetical protein